MRDRYFYPIAVLIIFAIITAALLPGQKRAKLDDQHILENGYRLSGDSLRKLTAAPATQLDFSTNTDGNVDAAILSSITPKNRAPLSAGVFGTLGGRYETLFGGKKLEVVVRARSFEKKPLTSFEMAYFTAGVGDSNWRRFDLDKNYQDFRFVFTPNSPKGTPGVDYVGIWPGEKGLGEFMEVESIRVKIIKP